MGTNFPDFAFDYTEYIVYRTTWIGEIMARERGIDPPVEEATRAGDLAMLFYSIGV
jgi:solute carrier family 45 protein 1/2/4